MFVCMYFCLKIIIVFRQVYRTKSNFNLYLTDHHKLIKEKKYGVINLADLKIPDIIIIKS